MQRAKVMLMVVFLAVVQPVLAREPLLVVSSIKPLQLLVTAIGGEEVDSRLLLPAGFSPHDARLKPSHWQLLKEADIVLWVGPELEQFLESALSRNKNAVALGAVLDEKFMADDPHVWLSVDNVADMAREVSEVLAKRRPLQAAFFYAQAARLVSALRQEHLLLKQVFTAAKPRYFLPHQGYTHFERQYGLQASAVLAPHAETMPGAAHVVELRSRLMAGEFDCVFREPQHESRMMVRLLEGIDTPQIALDPMGADIDVTETGYVEYYRQLGGAFTRCQGLAK
nr:zinc ABC transporter substrate-binding protein [Litorivivens lipolytica]